MLHRRRFQHQVFRLCHFNTVDSNSIIDALWIRRWKRIVMPDGGVKRTI